MTNNNNSTQELTPEQKKQLREDALKVYKNPLFRGSFASLAIDSKNYGKLGEELYQGTILGNYEDSDTAYFYNKVVKEIIANPQLAANRDTIGRRAYESVLEGNQYLKIRDAFELMGIDPEKVHDNYKKNLDDYLGDTENFDDLKSGLLEHMINLGVEESFKTRRQSIEELIENKYSSPKPKEEENSE